ADVERVVVVDLHQIGAEPRQEFALRLVHVDLGRHPGQQLLDARDASGHAPRGQAAPDVVLVRVGHQRTDQRHVVGGGRVDNGVDLPRRVDHHALARDGVAHEVDEVLHGAQLELLEVEAIVPGLHAGSCYRTPVDYARIGPLNDRSFDEPTSSVT